MHHSYGFIPYLRNQILSINHTGFHLLKRHVLPLCHTILLWCVGDRILCLDATLFTKVLQILVYICFTVISTKHFDIFPTLILNQGFPNLECLKDFRFEFEKLNPTKPWEIICEGQHITWSFIWRCRERSNKIWMHQSKHLSISPCFPFLIVALRMISNHTTNASAIGDLDRRNSFHHALFSQFLEVSVV